MSKLFRRKHDEETTYWLSYSDMMAGLLLCFVLIIALSALHSNIIFDQKQDELLGKEKELLVQSNELDQEKLTGILRILFSGFFDRLLNPCRMDPPVDNQLLKRDSRHFTSDRIKAG